MCLRWLCLRWLCLQHNLDRTAALKGAKQPKWTYRVPLPGPYPKAIPHILTCATTAHSLRFRHVTPHPHPTPPQVWSKFDSYGDYYIARTQLPKLVLATPPPLGLKGVGVIRTALALCMRLEIVDCKRPAAKVEPLLERAVVPKQGSA